LVELEKLVDAQGIVALEADNGSELVASEIALEGEKEGLEFGMKLDLDKAFTGRQACEAAPGDFPKVFVFGVSPFDNLAHEGVGGFVEVGVETLVPAAYDVFQLLDGDPVSLEIAVLGLDEGQHVENDTLFIDRESRPLRLVHEIVGNSDEILGIGLLEKALFQHTHAEYHAQV
jgi:hypothetical protein